MHVQGGRKEQRAEELFSLNSSQTANVAMRQGTESQLLLRLRRQTNQQEQQHWAWAAKDDGGLAFPTTQTAGPSNQLPDLLDHDRDRARREC